MLLFVTYICYLTHVLAELMFPGCHVSSVVSPAAALMNPQGSFTSSSRCVAQRGETCWAEAGRECTGVRSLLCQHGKWHPHIDEANLGLLIICKLCKTGY